MYNTGMRVVCLHTKFRIPVSITAVVVIVIPKAKEFLMGTMLVYILWKFLFLLGDSLGDAEMYWRMVLKQILQD